MLSGTSPLDAGSLFSAIDFAGRRCVIAAVSGGGDSLALLFLLRDYLGSLRNRPSILAVTVDHGLRAESAEEARAVGRLCAAHGIDHRVLEWEGPKPATGLPAAAREARLRLLARAADDAEGDLVFTGHTADDQAETLAMRMARGKGRGAAGIAPATLYGGRIWFVRPLLAARREELRAFLGARGIGWTDDPSNTDRRFERARVRQALHESEIERFTALARENAEAREKAGERAAALISSATSPVANGLLRLPRSAIEKEEANIAAYSLRILLAVAGGTQHLPDEARTAAILARMGEEDFHASLSRTVIACRRGNIYFHREGRNLPSLEIGGDFVWDGRYRVLSRDQDRSLRVAAFGARNAREVEIAGVEAPADLVRSALAAEPSLWEGERCLGLARSRPGISLRPIAGPWARLLPSFDLAPARAVAGLLDGEHIPPSPWRGHKEDGR